MARDQFPQPLLRWHQNIGIKTARSVKLGNGFIRFSKIAIQVDTDVLPVSFICFLDREDDILRVERDPLGPVWCNFAPVRSGVVNNAEALDGHNCVFIRPLTTGLDGISQENSWNRAGIELHAPYECHLV